MGKIRLPVVSTALMLLVAPFDAGAQYFGRNKVEYVDFDFRVLRTEHFDVYYYAREEGAARLAARLAERWYVRFSTILNHTFDRRQPLVLYGSQAEFAQTNVVSGLLPDSVGGVTESSRRRIVMPFAPTLSETNRVLGHEIVHAFQFDIGRRHGGTGQPLWFVEGMAEYLARGRSDPDAHLWLRDAATSGRLPRTQREAARRLSPYQYGYAFWSYLAGRFDDQVVEKALKPGKRDRRLKDRMRYATGRELETLFADWRASVRDDREISRPMREVALPPGPHADGAQPSSRFDAGRMQLGPSLSPDGRQAVFFSERDRFSLDLFVADVSSGRVTRKLATTAASARFDSLQPLRSAGAWSPNGEWFAFPAVRDGRAALMLVDMRDRGRTRELVFAALGQVLSPTWSPDGRTIAFSALAGGYTDLYTVDVATGSTRQLTDDAFADLQPAWSPDGRSLAFATERFSSDLETLRFGPPQLGIVDVASGEVRPVPFDSAGSLVSDAGTTQINPQWSADGSHLYFVGGDGIKNVFRLSLHDEALYQVTFTESGVTGVTPTSPALSVASAAPVLGFTVYRNGRYQLAILDDSHVAAGRPVVPTGVSTSARSSKEASIGLVDGSLADHRTGLPDVDQIADVAYSPRLSLEQLGQPYVTSGGGPFGTVVRAGGGLLFGDMLGERRLGAALQVGNRLRDAAFDVRFLNQARRWNWGALAELEPSLRRYRRTEHVEFGGEPALKKQADYLQRVQLRAAGLVAYPFNRGLRVEFVGGVRYSAYRRDVRSQVTSLATSRVLATEQVTGSGGVPTLLGEVGAALVGDTTVFGPTGPLLGSRYRLELAPSIGSLAFTRVLADYRYYAMPVRPYSIAVRLLHSARYGRDADDPRLLTSFLGSRYFVRGHNLDSRACRPVANEVCGGELLGSRLLVGNLEVRFPIWGMFSRDVEYGPLPADGFVFLDGGAVWSRDTPLTSRHRASISSMGGGIRLNAGGLPLEVAAVRALDGPRPRWLIDFGFRVGF